MSGISRRRMIKSGVLGTGFLLGGGLSGLAAGFERSPASEPGPPYGLEGLPNFKEYKAAKKAARQEIPAVRVDPDNPAILFHDYLCQRCGHCDETCTDQMTVSHYCKPAVAGGKRPSASIAVNAPISANAAGCRSGSSSPASGGWRKTRGGSSLLQPPPRSGWRPGRVFRFGAGHGLRRKDGRGGTRGSASITCWIRRSPRT